MNVLVTGAGGFIGRALTASLAEAGFQVRAAARDVTKVPKAPLVEPVVLPDLSQPVD